MVVEPLKRDGYYIDTISSLAEFKQIMHDINLYECIILDIIISHGGEEPDQFQEFPGIEILRILRQQLHSNIPIVVLSVVISQHELKIVRELGVSSVLHKPINRQTLKSAVLTAIGTNLDGDQQQSLAGPGKREASAFDEVVAKDWCSAIDLLYADSWQKDLSRYRSHLAFRGLSDSSYNLVTSLIRLGGSYQELEPHLIRNFRKYARSSQSGEDFSDWKWLTIGQHHGLPTRLLDWTYSPFAALHFCTSNTKQFDRDGAIWCVDYTRAHSFLPKPLKEQQSRSGSDVFTIGMIERVAGELPNFDALSPETFALFFEPPSLDDRIINQFALFSVLSNSSQSFDDWLSAQQGLCRRIIIPAEIKWEIRDKLDQANMTERVFFPGLDGLATWLGRHYSPRADAGA